MNNSSVLNRNQIVYPIHRPEALQHNRFNGPNAIDVSLLGCDQIFAPHGSTLVSQGADLDCALYILSGWVLEEEVTAEGEIAWADIILRGEFAGLNCVASVPEQGHDNTMATATITALTDVFAVRIPRRQLDQINHEDRAFAHLFHDTLRRQASHLHDQLVALSAKTANDRVLMMLRSLHRRAQCAFGLCPKTKLPVSQVVLARLANISVVHMNRIAQKLRHEGVLEWSHEGVRFLTERHN
jgi:CRP-like cAMP-binding protein